MSKKPHIVLHRHYGLNETRIICFWCKEPTGERMVMGNKIDHRAPTTIIVSYEACDSCLEQFDLGIHIVEYQETPPEPEQFPITEGVFPTGRWMVIDREYFTDVFDGEVDHKVYQLILAAGVAFLSPRTYELLRQNTVPKSGSLADMEVGGHA